jgi:uncharacterized protein (DUF1810 family)
MPFDLDRFIAAQDTGAFDAALAELRRGRKTSHWIWFVFPQLRGLGSSWAATRYGLDGVAEAEAYLAHPVLCARLLRVADVVREQLRRGIQLEDLMGSEVDAVKLVSSMTLFEHVARTQRDPDPALDLRALAGAAAEILATAEAQGYPRCRFTLGELPRRGAP